MAGTSSTSSLEFILWRGSLFLSVVLLDQEESSINILHVLLQVANLLGTALETHQWYVHRFSDYPQTRTALIPYLL